MASSSRRIPILYLIVAVLVLVSVLPVYFYASRVTSMNRDRLKVNEMMLQNSITRSLSEDLEQRQTNFRAMLASFTAVVETSTGGSLDSARISSAQVHTLLEKFVASNSEIAYAALLNAEMKGIDAGRVAPDDWMKLQINDAFTAESSGGKQSAQALAVGSGKGSRTVVLVTTAIRNNGNFVGLLCAFMDLSPVVRRLQDATGGHGGLVTYVVDQHGRLVAGSDGGYATGQDMTSVEIVKKFVDQGGKTSLADTHEFTAQQNGQAVDMLGTYTGIPSMGWAVVAQKTQQDAYADIRKMQVTGMVSAVFAVIMSLAIGFYAARKITTPLETLTESSRALARGDFSHRVRLHSQTEIGELAATFNVMSEELEHLVADLKRAAEENRALFFGSIQMLAGAVDEKDPYTRGHSDRVTRYSTAIAGELGMAAEEVEKVRIAAQLHDVGKIGIEDRILKKPGALTPEEFDVMKTHTTRGANILRAVRQLKEMIPGIELHHESLDGRGYPYGLKGEEIPVSARIIMVADAFDAMTTDRPYQKAMAPDHAAKIIASMAGKKFDEKCVEALTTLLERGELLHLRRTREAAAATAEA